MACGGTVGAAICRPGVSAPAEGRFHEGCAPHCVVAKSAGLRFRLRRKLPPLPCASSPHRAGRGGGPGLRHQKENGPRPVEEKKALRRASVQWPSARDGGRRIGASVDFALPSGTLQSSAKVGTAVPWRMVPTSSGCKNAFGLLLFYCLALRRSQYFRHQCSTGSSFRAFRFTRKGYAAAVSGRAANGCATATRCPVLAEAVALAHTTTLIDHRPAAAKIGAETMR